MDVVTDIFSGIFDFIIGAVKLAILLFAAYWILTVGIFSFMFWAGIGFVIIVARWL